MTPSSAAHPARSSAKGLRPLRLNLAIILLSTLLAPVFAEELSSSPDQLFVTGMSEYDAGNYEKAAEAWETLLQQGTGAPAVFYNLGNAYFKNGNFPLAVLYYQRAQSLIPRDTELKANLDFSLQQLNAPRESYPFWHQAARQLSRSEWQRTALTAYWLCALCLVLPLLSPRFRLAGLRLAGALGLVAFLCIPPIFIWKGFEKASPVILLQDTPVRYAPLENAAVHYEAPRGTLSVRASESGDWLKIQSGGKEGWVLKRAAQAVYPLDSIPP